MAPSEAALRSGAACALGLVLLALGCGSPAGDGSTPCGTPPSGTAVDGGLTCGLPFAWQEPGGAPGPLGVRAHIAVTIDLAGVVRTEAEATVHVLIAPRPAAPELLDVQICDIQFPRLPVPGQAAPTELAFGPAVYAALPQVAIPALARDETTCGAFVTDTGTFLVAARLSDARVSPLPADAAAETCATADDVDCLFDVEPDGQPAATLRAAHLPALDVESLFVTLRTEVALAGTLLTPERIAGEVAFGMDLAIVGCRLVPAGAAAARPCNETEATVVARLHPTITQLADPPSHFAAVRVPAGTGCPALVAGSDAIFGR